MSDDVEATVQRSQLLTHTGMTFERFIYTMRTVADDNTSVKLYLFSNALSWWKSPNFASDIISLDVYLKLHRINAWITHNQGCEEEDGMILWLSRSGVHPAIESSIE